MKRHLLVFHQSLYLHTFYLFLLKQNFGTFLKDILLASENLECFGIFRIDDRFYFFVDGFCRALL